MSEGPDTRRPARPQWHELLVTALTRGAARVSTGSCELLSRGRVRIRGTARVPLDLGLRVRRSGHVELADGVHIQRHGIDFVEGTLTVGGGSLVRTAERFRVFAGGELVIGERCVIEAGARILVHGRLVIGDDVYIGRDGVIVALRQVVIGSGTLLGERVSIHDANHGPPHARDQFVTSPVNIGRLAWLGAGSVVVAGGHVGNETTVAANAVVTRDLPDRVLAGGVPARVLKALLTES